MPKRRFQKIKDKKFLLNAGLTLMVFVATAGIVWGILALRKPSEPPVNDEYFVTDDTKYVVDLSPTGNSTSVKTHVVYTYDGDTVTGMKTYFEYADEESAERALESVKNLVEFANSQVELEGRYIVATANEDQYKGLTASDVKQQTEAIRQFQSSRAAQESNPSPEENSENSEDHSDEHPEELAPGEPKE